MLNKFPRDNDPTKQQNTKSHLYTQRPASFILGPISITPIVYKNQVSGHGFWTKFFMVFSYTVFLSNMFLRYTWAYPGFQVRVKKIMISGLGETRNVFGIKISCTHRIFSICRGAYAPNRLLTSNPYIY